MIVNSTAKAIQQRKDSLFNIWYWSKWASTGNKQNLNLYLKLYTKCITDLNVKCKPINLVQKKKHRRKSSGSGPGKQFLYLTPKAWSIKGIADKRHFIKIKNFCSQKTLLRGWKHTNWQRYLQTTHLTKKLVSNRNASQNTTVKKSYLKQTKDMNRTFYQKGNTDRI